MRGKLFLVLTAAALLLLTGGHAQEAVVSTREFVPPDLSGLTAESPAQWRVLAVAQQEVGYRGGENYANKYSDWLGNRYSPWCTEFITWCVSQSDQRWGSQDLGTVFPRTDTAAAHALYYLEEDRFIGVNGCSPEGERQWLIGESAYLEAYQYLPQMGDVMWLKTRSGRDRADHSTLVEGVSRGEDGQIYVHVIEGNQEDCVRRHAYLLTDPQIVGFGTPERRAYTCLRIYSRFGGVNELRLALQTLGYTVPSRHLQRMDAAMRDALKLFQERQRLEVTGQADIATRTALERALKEKQR